MPSRVRSTWRSSDANAAVEQVAEALAEHLPDRLDGLTVDFGDGSWFNLRPSNTEPLLRLNVEAATPSRVDEVVKMVTDLVRGDR